MDGESVERLMDIILQMRINLQQVTVTFQQQTEEIREQLEGIFDEERKALDGCLNSIDGKLRECAGHVDDYSHQREPGVQRFGNREAVDVESTRAENTRHAGQDTGFVLDVER